MTYDNERGRVVLFGGSNATISFNDVWEWDGTSWVEVKTAGEAPAARSEARSAYDSYNRRLVAFGGTYSGSDQNDTWEGLMRTDDRPGHTMEGHFYASGAPTDAVWMSVKATFRAGGSGRRHTTVLVTTPVNFAAAAADCVTRGGRLATPATSGEQAELAAALAGQPGATYHWIGLTDSITEGSYEWLDNSRFEYTNWRTGDPVAAGDCTALRGNDSYKWSTQACGNSYPYACEVFEPKSGAELRVLDAGGWRTVASNDDPETAPDLIEWTSTDVPTLARLAGDPQRIVRFSVVPAEPNGNGFARISVDYAEVVVKYRMP